MKARFSVFKRKTGLKTPSFYVRFTPISQNSRYVVKSIDKLNEELSFFLGERKITKRYEAVLIAEESLKRDMVFNRSKDRDEKSRFNDYVCLIWDYEKSPYIKRKLKEKPDSITRKHVDDISRAFQLHAMPFIPSKLLLSEFSPSIVEKIKDRMLDDGLSSSTINKVVQAIRTAVKEAYRVGDIKENIADRIINVTSNQEKERGIPSTDEVKKLLDYLNDCYPVGAYDRAYYLITAIAVFTGMRESEIRTLHAKAIHLHDKTAIIDVDYSYNPKDKLKCTKNRKKRNVTIPLILAIEVLDYAGSNPVDGGFIFWSVKNPSKPISTNAILNHFYSALEAIGVDRKARNIVFHSLRHFFSSIIQEELTSDEARRLLGHSSLKMTEHYTHETTEHLLKMDVVREKAIPSSMLNGGV